MSKVAIWLIIIFGAIVYGFLYYEYLNIHKQTGDEARKYADYKTDVYALVIKKRDQYLFDAIIVKMKHHMITEHVPDTYAYSSTTRNGVTTGSMTKISGGMVTRRGLPNGEGSLTFKYAEYNSKGNAKWEGNLIHYISLPRKDYEIAKTDPVLSRYLSNNTFFRDRAVKYYGCMTEEEAQYILDIRDMKYEDAVYIRNWLRGMA